MCLHNRRWPSGRLLLSQDLIPYPSLCMCNHGGTLEWRKDHTLENMHGVFYPLVAKGFLLVSLGYRLSGTVSYPANIEDVEAGVRWLKPNTIIASAECRQVDISSRSLALVTSQTVQTVLAPSSTSTAPQRLTFQWQPT